MIVIENIIEKNYQDFIEEQLFSSQFPWNFLNDVTWGNHKVDVKNKTQAFSHVFFDNNRVETFYVGAEAMIGENRLMFRGSLSNAIGGYGSEYIPVKKQLAVGLQWQRQIFVFGQDAFLSANIGADMGSWKKDLVGGNFTLSLPIQ